MNIGSLVRDGALVRNSLKTVDNGIVTKTGCKVYIPKHYASGKLGSMVENIQCIGFFAIVVDGKHYAVNKTCATVTLSPDSINVVSIDEDPYLELTFNAGSIVVLGGELVLNGSLLFQIYDELVAKGRTPWYMNYRDLGAIFDSAKIHSGVNLKAARSVLEMLAASRARVPDDRAKYYRNTLKLQKDVDTKIPDMIPLRSVGYGATSTLSRVMGSYLNEGLSSTLVNPSERLESVEELLLR